jgi:hypothetical protein
MSIWDNTKLFKDAKYILGITYTYKTLTLILNYIFSDKFE